MDANSIAESFFETYSRALLHRDARRIAGHYDVPALIEFPGQPIAVTSPTQTEQFFARAFDQYAGISEADTAIVIVAATGHSIWADVTWTYDNDAPGERNLYQLVRSTDGEWKIAVLTPMNT